ncbi:MAG: ABC transporter permease [Acidobacteriota bacterium]|nr:ABC transporter permease [Acidobacteriota bacterium]
MEEHLALQTAENIRAGLPPAEARRQALLKFGAVEAIREDYRAEQRILFVETLVQDLRYGLRTLRKAPGFAAVAVLTLALGVGATTAVFSVLDGVVLRPLPYPHPEQLVSVGVSPAALDPSLRGMAPEDYFVFRDQSRTFQDIGIYAETDTDRDVNVTGFTEPERVHALNVTHGVLSVLGIPPLLGRIFSPSDDSPGAPPTAILTYAYWQRKFSANPAAVGKTIIVDGVGRQVIGVTPRSFRFLDMQDLAVILPLQLDRNKTFLGGFSYFGIARLTPGSTLAQASADVARMLPITLNAFPPSPGLSVESLRKARFTPSLLPLKQDIVGNVGTLLWVLMGSMGIVLLIACANVANLLLARTEGRQRELALRAALGASRGRIAVQLLTESAILGLLGSIFGLVLASAGLRFLVALAPSSLPRIRDIGVNLPVLYFALGMTLFSSFLFGLIPVLKHAGVRAGVPESDRTLGLSRERHRSRNLLVTLQVALALVLLICSGLMIRTFRALTQVDPGFLRPAGLQTFRIAIPESDVPDDAGVPHVEQRIQDKLANIPGVSSAGFSSAVPMDGDNRLDNVFAADRAYASGVLPPLRHLLFVSPGYFHTLGIPLIAGRDLTWADTYNRVPVALISENFAREYWGTPAAALGKRIRIATNDDWRQIIGVVGNVRDDGMDKPARTDVYWPALLEKFRSQPLRVQRYATFVVRSPLAGSSSFVKQIRQAVWSVDANLPLASVYTMNYFYTLSMARTSLTLVMLGIAGAMALLLGTVGLSGVIAYSVSLRTREIGIRMALGAQRRDVMRLVLGEGMFLILVGLAIGLAGSLALTRFLSSLLFGVSATDPLTFACVAVLLTLVALAACYIPARRAMRVDPVAALQHD